MICLASQRNCTLNQQAHILQRLSEREPRL
jgi:hypothetical protein